MSDRKYRQRGYQDDDRPAPVRRERQSTPREFRAPNMPGFRQIVRCARCGQRVAGAIDREASCAGCGTALHACVHCAWFDTGKRFECAKPIPARIAPKDARNDCELFQARVTVERETGSARTASARDAFDDLFK